MATIHNLMINLGINTLSLGKGAKRAIKDITGLQSSVMGSAVGIDAAFSLITRAFRIGGHLARFASQVIDNVAGLRQQASSLGLAVEKYQALSFAAASAGISQEDFRKQVEAGNTSLGLSEGFLAGAAAQAEALGINMSAIDTAKVEAAHIAFEKVQAAVMGLANQIAVALSPYLEAAANQVLAFIESSGGMKSIVATGLEAVITALGYAADFLGNFTMGWKFLKAIALGALSSVASMLDFFANKLADVVNLFSGLTGLEVENSGVFGDLSQGMDAEIERLQKSMVQQFKAGPWSEQLRSALDGIAASSVEAAKARVESGIGIVADIEKKKSSKSDLIGAVQGSAEAASIINKIRGQAGNQIKDVVAEVKKSNKLLSDMVREMAGQSNMQVAIV